MPSETNETIKPTAIRIPRIHARPPIFPGSNVIRSNLLSLPTNISLIAAFCVGVATAPRIASPLPSGNLWSPLPAGLAQTLERVGVVLGPHPRSPPANSPLESAWQDSDSMPQCLLQLFDPTKLAEGVRHSPSA